MMRSPQFWGWFGRSRTVSADGVPLVLFHGTAADFETFDPAADPVNDEGYLGAGVYFDVDFQIAAQYALMAADATGGQPRVIGAYVRIVRPYAFARAERDTRGMDRESVVRWTRERAAQGYDGACNAARTEWVAYSPEQIAIVCSVPLFDPHLRPALVKNVRR
jgi:hypothetical protein